MHANTVRVQIMSKGRRVPFFGEQPYFSSAQHPWAGYSFETANSPAERLTGHAWPKTTLLTAIRGRASLHWKHCGMWHRDEIRPGVVSIMRRDAEIQSAEASNTFPLMVMQLDNAKLRDIAPDHVLTIEGTLGSAQVAQDSRLTALMAAMLVEAKEGCRSGRLFGETMSLALLAYLAGTYARPRRADGGESSLSLTQMRSVVDYIRANVTNEVTVTALASLVQMSPSHFSRLFKASFGVSPYRFVMQERVEGAKNMLVGTRLTASQLAMEFGFSSQSHFVKVFRQFTGVTPRQYRRAL